MALGAIFYTTDLFDQCQSRGRRQEPYFQLAFNEIIMKILFSAMTKNNTWVRVTDIAATSSTTWKGAETWMHPLSAIDWTNPDRFRPKNDREEVDVDKSNLSNWSLNGRILKCFCSINGIGRDPGMVYFSMCYGPNESQNCPFDQWQRRGMGHASWPYLWLTEWISKGSFCSMIKKVTEKWPFMDYHSQTNCKWARLINEKTTEY